MLELSGKKVAAELLQEYVAKSAELRKKNIIPRLSIVRVGAREDDLAYERGIIKRFAQADVEVSVTELPADVTQLHLERILTNLDEDDMVHGILLFRPLPKHLDENRAKNIISYKKDVDCMTDANFAHVFAGDGKGYPPCTPEAVVEMLKNYKIPLAGKKVTVVGRSMVVGKPLAMLLLKENATVKICHTKTADLKAECKDADIICAAAGCAKMITADYVRPGQIIMDVGINLEDGKLCGDVDYEGVSAVAEAVTPVPGGVGSVTTTMLLKHVLESAENAQSYLF